MLPSPLLRYVHEHPVAARAPPRAPGSGMIIPSFTTLAAWLSEIDRQGARMRPRSRLYERFDRTARTLTAGRIRREDNPVAVALLVRRLRAARHPWGHGLHDLDRVWSRAELGVLLTEAVNRQRQLAIGRVAPRPKGPPFDPRRLPDDRLEHLIQHHRDLQVVEALRAERRRREALRGDHASA